MEKRFIKTTSENFNNLSDKSEYDNSIVFIQDKQEIYSGGKYYSNTNYGVCSTSASAPFKTVTIESVKNYYEGLTINVKFTNTNTASSPSLNVNSLGVKNIVWNNTSLEANMLKAGNVYQFIYDCSSTVSYWRLLGGADIPDLSTIRTNATNGNTAYSWGNHASAGYISGITKNDIITALGYTPYNSTNPNGYTTNTGNITEVTAGNGLTGGASTGTATLNVGAGTGITVAADSVGISSTYQTYISNGNIAYGWGNHANAGYFKPEIIFNNSSSGWVGDGATVSYPETGVVRGTSTTSSYPRIRHAKFQSISLEVGKSYKLSFYAKSSESQTVKTYIGNNTGSVLGMSLGNITTTTSWKKYELFGIALLANSTVSAYGLQIYIATSNISSSGRYTDFKDIKFEPISEGERLHKRVTDSTSVSIVLYPNDYFVCSQPTSSLTISELKPPTNTTIPSSYIIQFTPSVSDMTFSYPSTIKWMNGEAPTIFDSTCKYQISIVENLATYQKFK